MPPFLQANESVIPAKAGIQTILVSFRPPTTDHDSLLNKSRSDKMKATQYNM